MLLNSLEKSPRIRGTRSWAGELSTSTPPTLSHRQSPPLPAWVLQHLLHAWARPPHSFALGCVKHNLCFLKSYLLESASSKKPPQMYRTHDDQPHPEFSPSAGSLPSPFFMGPSQAALTAYHSAQCSCRKELQPTPGGGEATREAHSGLPHIDVHRLVIWPRVNLTSWYFLRLWKG